MMSVVALVMLCLVWPATARAQPHHHHGGHFAVGVGFGPYFYPGFYYSAWFGPYGWWGYPWGPWGPWPAYAYFDNSSSIRIQGAPHEAEVYVDGYFAGVVDDFDGTFQRLHIPPGEHEVVIYLEGYRPTKQMILFRPGASYKINATLEKLAPGESPSPRPKPAPGTAQTFTAQPAEPAERQPASSPSTEQHSASADSPAFGTLVVRVQPSGAEIRIDGERWEGPEEPGERLVVQLATGNHRVEIRKDEYQPYSTDVVVRGNESSTLNVSLPPERH
jgi:hypothetical protein